MADAIAQRPKSVSGILCVSSRVEPWTEMGFAASWGKLSRALEAEGVIGRGLTSHDLRHTLGARLREAGAEDRTVADILGQRSTAMARRYSEASALPDHAKDLVSNLNLTGNGAPASANCLHRTENVLTRFGRLCEPIEIIGSPSRTRTYDLAINSRVLYQLSYRGKSMVRAYSKGWRRLPTPLYPFQGS